MWRLFTLGLGYCCCAAAAVSAIAQPAPAIGGSDPGGVPEQPKSFLSEITHPAAWLSWGFDSRSRWELVDNGLILQDGPNSELSYLRFRNRLWVQVEPLTNVVLNARLMSEPRYIFKPDATSGWATQEGLLDELFLDWAKIGGLPVRIKAGRQEMQFGDRWIIYDGTAMDGSRTEFFDAVRATVETSDKKTSVDLLGILVRSEADDNLPFINDLGDPLAEQDECAGVLYASHEVIPELRVDGFYIYRHLSQQLKNGLDGDLHTPGVRFWSKAAGSWDYSAQGAVQLGDVNGHEVFAWGWNTEVGLKLGGEWKHRVYVGHEYLSGDDPDTDQQEGWDPAWSRRGRFSELMVFTFAAEANGRRGYFTNLQRPNVGWGASPTDKLELKVEYSPMLANSNPMAGSEMFSEDGQFRGHYMLTMVKYAASKHVAFTVRNELFFPGDYYQPDHRATADFLRVEMNVTF